MDEKMDEGQYCSYHRRNSPVPHVAEPPGPMLGYPGDRLPSGLAC